jgi:hypothetical protein
MNPKNLISKRLLIASSASMTLLGKLSINDGFVIGTFTSIIFSP